MRLPYPSASEERWLSLAGGCRSREQRDFLAARTGPWRRVGLFTRLGFGVLGLLAAVAVAAIIFLLKLPLPWVVAGVLLIVVAEWLIARRHLYRAGLEEALLLCGLWLIGYWAGNPMRSVDHAMLTVAAVFLLSGLRLRNALFVSIAALAASGALAMQTGNRLAPGLACLALAVLALAAGARRYQRPSSDRLLDWLVIFMPVAGYAWLALDAPFFRGANLTRPAWLLGYGWLSPAVFGVLALIIGLRRRRHAPLLASMLCTGCVAWELRELTGLSLMQRLLVWGTVTLIAAVLLDRWLRRPRHGITSQRLDDGEAPLELLSVAGAAAITPPGSAPERTVQGGGGDFAGGGASGRF